MESMDMDARLVGDDAAASELTSAGTEATAASELTCWLNLLPNELLRRMIDALHDPRSLAQLAATALALRMEVDVYTRESLRTKGSFTPQWLEETPGKMLARLHRIRMWGASQLLLVGAYSMTRIISSREIASEVAKALWDSSTEASRPFRSRGTRVVTAADNKACAAVCELGSDRKWALMVVAADRIAESKVARMLDLQDLARPWLGLGDHVPIMFQHGRCAPIDTIETIDMLEYAHSYRATALTTLRHRELDRIPNAYPYDSHDDEARTVFKLYALDSSDTLVGICAMHFTNPDNEYMNKGGPTLRKLKARDAACRLALYTAIAGYAKAITACGIFYCGRLQLNHCVMQAHPRFFRSLGFKDTTGEGDFSIKLRDDGDTAGAESESDSSAVSSEDDESDDNLESDGEDESVHESDDGWDA